MARRGRKGTHKASVKKNKTVPEPRAPKRVKPQDAVLSAHTHKSPKYNEIDLRSVTSRPQDSCLSPVFDDSSSDLDSASSSDDDLLLDSVKTMSLSNSQTSSARRSHRGSFKNQSTFQKQMNPRGRAMFGASSTQRQPERAEIRHSIINQYSDAQAEQECLARMRDLEQSGSNVINTLSKVFSKPNNNWHRAGYPQKDVRQILEEAKADQNYKKLRRNSRIIIQIKSDSAAVLPRVVIHPEEEWRSWWDVFMMLLVSYYAVITPINIAFDKSPFNIMSLELLFNTFFVLDIVLQFFTSYKHESGPNAGRLEASHRAIVIHYLKGWFLIDLMASFPMELFLMASGLQSESEGGNTLNRLLRLVRGVKLMRILRMSRIWKRLLVRARLNPSLVRLVKLFGFLLIEWHWIGCTYWAIAVAEGFEKNSENKDSWTPLQLVDGYNFGPQYIRAYFWAVMVTTGVGKDIIPTTNVQFIFTTMAIIVGVLMYALIVGSVGTALSSIDTPDSQRRRRMDAVREYLRQRGISEQLTEKVLNYYDYCYTRHISQHDEAILEDIHSVLKEKLDLEMNQQLLQKVPRFQQLPEALLLILIHSLVSRIYLPNELVYMIGERASEMFFVARGDLEELDTHGRTNCFHDDGAFFGDQLFQNNARRTTTVRCISHCELLILTKTSLRKIMKIFPEFAMMVQKWSGQQRWQALRGWDRVQYAVRTLRSMRMMGAKDSTFIGVMRHLNEMSEDSNTMSIQVAINGDFQQNLSEGRPRRASRVKSEDISYDQFRDQYAAAFTKVHEQMEKARRKKQRLQRLKLKKIRQKKAGGKMSHILGQDVVETLKKETTPLLEPLDVCKEEEEEDISSDDHEQSVPISSMDVIQEGSENSSP